jgi:hypothetical protein
MLQPISLLIIEANLKNEDQNNFWGENGIGNEKKAYTCDMAGRERPWDSWINCFLYKLLFPTKQANPR